MVVGALVDGQRSRLDARCAQLGDAAVEPPPGRSVRDMGPAGARHQPLPAVRPALHGDDADVAVAVGQQVLDQPARGGLVVDPDRPAGRQRRPFHDDQRDPAPHQRIDARVVVGQRVGHEGVDNGPRDRTGSRAATTAVAGQHQEAGVVRSERLGEPVEQGDTGGVAEGVRGSLGQEDPDSSRAAPPQAAGHRVG
jgi:hypothetical protein